MRGLPGLLLLVLLLAGTVGAADLSVPSEITSPGYYRLTGDLLDGGVTVRSGDVILDGDGHLLSRNAGDGTPGVLVIGPLTNVTVLNLTLAGWDTGLECRDLVAGRIAGVRAENCTENGLYLEHCRDVEVLDCTAVKNGYPGLAVNNSERCRVTRSTANENADVGIYLAGCRDVAVADSTAAGNGLNGVYLENAERGEVRGCSLVRNGYPGVALSGSQGVLISDNLLHENRLAAIWIERPERCVVTRNAAGGSEVGLVVRNTTSPPFAGGNLWLTGKGVEGTTRVLPSLGLGWHLPGALDGTSGT